MQRGTLHSNRELIVSVCIDEQANRCYAEIQSTKNGPDLSITDEVVVVFDGQPRQLNEVSAKIVRADLGEPVDLEGQEKTLFVRVFDYFESWEIDF